MINNNNYLTLKVLIAEQGALLIHETAKGKQQKSFVMCNIA